MGAKTAEDIEGYEYDWIACDEDGFVGMFSTAGGGYAPVAYLAETDLHQEAVDEVLRRDKVTSADMSPSVAEGLQNPWKELAERGVFSYDADYTGEPYRLVGVPTAPVRLDELHLLTEKVVMGVVLRGIKFGKSITVTREDIIRSEEK